MIQKVSLRKDPRFYGGFGSGMSALIEVSGSPLFCCSYKTLDRSPTPKFFISLSVQGVKNPLDASAFYLPFFEDQRQTYPYRHNFFPTI